MKEFSDFRVWMQQKGTTKRVISDCVSRLKHIRKKIKNFDFETEYKKDNLDFILNNLSSNSIYIKNKTFTEKSVPSLKYAVKKFKEFKDNNLKR